MLRPLSTYLLLIITCSFSLMGLTGICLGNFADTTNKAEISIFVESVDNTSFINIQNHTLPSIPVDENSLIDNFDFENEVEVEIDVLPTIEMIPCYFSFNNFQSHFLNVYSTYSFKSIKVEFLDIFSPPPNC